MEHKHLDAAALEHLLSMDRTEKQNEQLFHLLAVCPRCREVGGWLLELHQANALPPVFGPIDAALARSRAEAPQLLGEFLSLDPEERLARIHTDQRFVSWGLCELLIAATHGSAKDRLRLEWVEGRTAAGLGDHELARRLLTKVRQTFLAEDNPFDAALAALDLAISYLKEGKTTEVRELADEMVTVFQTLEVAREPLAALLLFQEAARRETATGDLAREVAASLTRARSSWPGQALSE